MLVATIVGARPQFVKMAPVSRALRRNHREIVIHTGQHYDDNLSRIFFEHLELPAVDHNLGVGSGPAGWQSGQMLQGIEEVLLACRPDAVLVYGDTNSTLAGALAGAKLHIPVAHVEAGLRSFSRRMPEEVNRIVADHLATLLFCPTRTAVKHLRREGIRRNVFWVGDVMLDAVLGFADAAERRSRILPGLGLQPGSYVVATVHRAENTDDPERLRGIVDGLLSLDRTTVFPVHPRTRRALEAGGFLRRLDRQAQVRMCDPLGYLDMLVLVNKAYCVLTDSGGVQKEAFFLRVPCITLRDETEWPETVQLGANVVAGTRPADILAAFRSVPRLRAGAARRRPWLPRQPFGDGHAAEKIVAVMERCLERADVRTGGRTGRYGC